MFNPTLWRLCLSRSCLLLSCLLLSTSATAHQQHNNYTVGAGDKIAIDVYGETDLSFNVMIDSSGSVDYPYLGEIVVVGLTPSEIKQKIYSGLKGSYLISPKVMVSIAIFRQFYIKGEVKRPGGYPFRPGLTVDKAIALAGGFTERAAKQSIMLSNNSDLNQTHKVTPDDHVAPDDILNIEESFF
ncbi:polysaccharide biosynthesis/export family protein [Moritella dasanensis]|uniref:polysaccharide biosynthesis/export family protein n=1 Tax=Moritella dasanensis TaxID=428031 RepID=UPI0003002414|nr:polysaccharide biosynthesis/export family protein [Moritella dasanensis]